MKRYLLFAGYDYYPVGGMDDLVDDFDTMEEVDKAIKKLKHEDWCQILDLQNGSIQNKRIKK